MTKQNFDACIHLWKLHIDADKCSGPAAGNTMMICEKCNHLVTLTEKCALEEVKAQKRSLKIQEKNTNISKWANIIAAVTLVIAFFTLLFGNKILECLG